MFVSIYYMPSLFNAHTMIFIVHIFMNVNKLCLNQEVKEVLKKIISKVHISELINAHVSLLGYRHPRQLT